MNDSGQKFECGDKVFAKMKGYPPWPARVISLSNESPNQKRRYHVHFYGTNQTAVVRGDNVYSFVENRTKFSKPKKHKYFTEALIEIEAELKSQNESKGDATIKEQISHQDNPLTSTTDSSFNDSSTPSQQAALKKPKPKNAQSLQNKVKHKIKRAKSDNESHPPPPLKKAKKNIQTNAENDALRNIQQINHSPKNKQISTPTENQSDNENFKNDDELTTHKDDHEPTEFIVANINGTENTVKIPLNLNRPNCLNISNAIIWDEMVLDQAKSIQKRIESGEKINDPYELMNEWTLLKSFEFVKNDMHGEKDKKKFEFLCTEAELLEIDIDIKRALNLQESHPEKCLELLDKLDKLTILPLMLKKQPDVVYTIRRMRNYVGNIKNWNMNDEELQLFKDNARLIRRKAQEMYDKFKMLFDNRDVITFWEYFNTEVQKFQEKTSSLPLQELLSLVKEPE